MLARRLLIGSSLLLGSLSCAPPEAVDTRDWFDHHDAGQGSAGPGSTVSGRGSGLGGSAPGNGGGEGGGSATGDNPGAGDPNPGSGGSGPGGTGGRPPTGGTGGGTSTGGTGGRPLTGGTGGGGGTGGTGGTGPKLDAGGKVDVAPIVSADAGPPVKACKMTISYTTQSQNAGYYPRDYTAAWIVGPTGKFVKTVFAAQGGHDGCLRNWQAALGTAMLNKSAQNAMVDAVTSATRNKSLPSKTRDAKDTLNGSWNCTDYNKMPVSAGAYQLCMEMCEGGSVPKSCVPFTLGTQPFTVMPPDENAFLGRSIEFVPAP